MDCVNRSSDVSELGLRLTNLRINGGFAVGAEIDGKIVNITQAGAIFGLPAPVDIDDLLQNQRGADIRAIVERIRASDDRSAIEVTQVEFAPLVTRPSKIICVGFNYRSHAAEIGAPVPKAPPLFSKFANALNSNQGVVPLPTHIDHEFDYETELVLVFGQRCHQVAEADALSVLAGYAVGNDISARGLQNITSQFTAGKTSDGFAPIGPWLVSRNLVANPNALRLKTWMNGELRQDSSTEEMIFNCRQLIHYVTSIMTIEPGDILFTGTPPGVIWGQNVPRDQRRWLKSGDKVTSSIEGLGELNISFS
ncbi:FAA hydrolase family protein [Serratia sp. S1B]|nr:FAA hydrolase family protein [Serratia sp. S1B]